MKWIIILTKILRNNERLGSFNRIANYNPISVIFILKKEIFSKRLDIKRNSGGNISYRSFFNY